MMKRQMKLLMIVIILVLISGCARRLPELYELWMGGNRSEFEVKKALLECGYPGYWSSAFFKKDFTLNDELIASQCMLKSGFSGSFGKEYPNEYSYKSACGNPKGAYCETNSKGVMTCDPRPPVCDMPLSEIPNRSVQRRLEGPFCVAYPKDPLCKP